MKRSKIVAVKVGLISLGCAKNLVDSEIMLGILREKGYQFTENAALAEVLVVNTCGFIESAKEESINTILEMAAFKTSGNCKVLIVTGCLAQKYKTELMVEMPEIDGILGTGEIMSIVKVIEKALSGEKLALLANNNYLYDDLTPRRQSTPKYTAYIKIAEGCNNKCSFCIIPELRGPQRSRALESIISEAQSLVAGGVREIILIAQDTTCYGQDIYHERQLAKLLSELDKIDGLVWIRLMYAYPTYFSESLIQAIANLPKVCKYIDIPLQHINNDILKAMHRKGQKRDIIELLNKIKQEIPEITLRTSLIVGFPGETEAQFNELLDFVNEIKFDRLGVFTYSQEEGTPAALLPNQVAPETKELRQDILMQAQQKKSLQKNRQKINKIFKVVIEGISEENPELFIGRTQGDAPEIDGLVYVKGNQLQTGDFVQVKVTHAYEYDIMGEVI